MRGVWIVMVALWPAMAFGQYTLRSDGYYYGSDGKPYTRQVSTYYSNGCQYQSYSYTPAYVEKKVEYPPPAPKLEYKASDPYDPFEQAVADAVRSAAKLEEKTGEARLEADKTHARWDHQRRTLETLLGGRALFGGYARLKGAIDVSGLSPPPGQYGYGAEYKGNTQYGESYSRVTELFGKIDRDAALAGLASGARAWGDAAQRANDAHRDAVERESARDERVGGIAAQGETFERTLRAFGDTLRQFAEATRPEPRATIVEESFVPQPRLHIEERSTRTAPGTGDMAAKYCFGCHSLRFARQKGSGIVLEGSIDETLRAKSHRSILEGLGFGNGTSPAMPKGRSVGKADVAKLLEEFAW